MEILNKTELDGWLNERREMGRDLTAVKGTPPTAATYDDGEPLTRPINVAWRDVTTGETFAIEYAV
ncbi:hypothetical protein [Pontibacterium sp.]|uniref:hypothetical protein n=1 Tax=Pontibacterium sp. TaxID=2036026 RepID=UPI0035652EA4